MAALDAAVATADLANQLDKQLALLNSADSDAAAQGRALAVVCVLLSRASEQHVDTVAAAVPRLAQLAAESADHLVQANAVAALTAAAALDDQLAASVTEHAVQPLAALLQRCTAADAPQQADLQLNVVSALGQLARDQQPAAEALVQPSVLPCLLGLADASQPPKLQEAVSDSLCALASHEWARPQLCAAGAVAAAAGLLDVSQLEVSVRCLMALGMLLAGDADAQAQLAASDAALGQLLALLKQQQDLDAKIIARDLLSLLLKNDALRETLEAAMRAQAQQPAAAAAAAAGQDASV